MPLPSAIQDLLEARSNRTRVFKSGPATRALLANEVLRTGRGVVYLAESAEELRTAQGLLELVGEDWDRPVWERDWVVLPPLTPGGALGAHTDRSASAYAVRWAERMACLFALARGERARGVALTVDNFLPVLPPRDLFDQHQVPLAVGEELLPEMLLDQVVSWGYERVSLVTRPGEIAVRGDIFDIFAPGYASPLRVEFFGDLIEEMRLFDPISQRSRATLAEAVVLPVSPLVLTEDFRAAAQALWSGLRAEKKLSENEEYVFQRRLDEGDARIPPGMYYERGSRMEEWLPREALLMLPASEAFDEAVDAAYWAWDEALRAAAESGPERGGGAHPAMDLVARPPDAVRGVWDERAAVVFERLVMGVEREGIDLPERRIGSFEELFHDADQELVRNRPWHVLVDALRRWSSEHRQTLLSFQSARSRKKFLALAEQDGIKPHTDYGPDVKGLFALVSPLKGGMFLAWSNVLLVAEDILQPGAARRPPPPRDFKGLARFDDLAPGDLLVHRDYGLGRFVGLTRMDLSGADNDFLLLHFFGEDKLYLPVDRLNLVQRYKGPEGIDPSLDRLGGVGWVKSRDKARKAIEAIARDLVEMYAFRKIAKGYTYGPPGEDFREFEAAFGFEETPDQARAIAEVLADMEKPEPMDRLVCGDVGFGKTEIAMRAAFRAVVDGKQVALLCPTTVLAEQHYQTFRARFAQHAVNVGMLSRFVPRARQLAVVKAAARGQVDILIGTHRLLSKDVELPGLGLMILDEEQRFGVRHKERLKEMRKNVDALTLTATPIPRTLQLSLSGVRELSVIETPPPERKAVETALVERDEHLLAGVLQRELARGGQIFWVYNRVRGLAEVKRYVEKLAPKATVDMAHGQMGERALEDAMHRFWHGESDILVCTSIVESGLDFPRANTLIVDQAQMFGLGQLYQLRGRVGRSDRQAYAYFVVRDAQQIPEIARKRLKVVLDMDYLGAGFQVAMEDLRLRGAGNILGEVQSGHIAKVGLDLFLEMLEEEVRRLKGDTRVEAPEPELAIGFAAHIPEGFVPGDAERLKYYKSLSSVRGAADRADLESEMRDRFGPFPDEFLSFLAVLDVKEMLRVLHVAKADLYPNKIKLTWPEKTSNLDPGRLVGFVGARPGRARLVPPATLELKLEEAGGIRERMRLAMAELAQLGCEPDPQG